MTPRIFRSLHFIMSELADRFNDDRTDESTRDALRAAIVHVTALNNTLRTDRKAVIH